MENFTPFSSLLGGAMIGLAASAMLLLHGKIAGISGIIGGLLTPRPGDMGWRLLFAGGLLLGGTAFAVVSPGVFASDLVRSPLAIVVAGLLVGFGTRLANGCTSGHAVCGLTRFSRRSAAAVFTFMLTGGLAAMVGQRWLGGAL